MNPVFQLPAGAHPLEAHLQISNLERSLNFYQEILGLQPVAQPADSAAASRLRQVALSPSGGPPVLLRLTELPGARPRARHTSGLYHLALRLPDRRSLALLLQRLVEHGWPISGVADHLVSEAIYLSDPDRLGLELYIDRPRATWNWQDGQVVMATDPLDLNDLLREASGAAWTGLPPTTDLGHVHLHVSDLASAEEFYSRRLGFQVMQRAYPGALFLAAGGYHHHLGLNIWAGAGAPPPAPEAVGLLWFSLAIPGPAAYQELLERLRSAGLPFSSQDAAALSPAASGSAVLVQDPAGNRVELRLEA
jgi:catechol 2,3-dioxygenase